jgi:hypothetical protein
MIHLTMLSVAHVQRDKIFLTIFFRIVIDFLSIIHSPVFLRKIVSETGLCLCIQVET